jgi:hypothetical protein
LLTDAVMTAIAVHAIAVGESIVDEFLDGLLPLLRHAAAVGLWKLAVDATSTQPEKAIQDAAEATRSAAGPSPSMTKPESVGRYRLLLVAEALDEEVAWHSTARFHVASNIARDLLQGPQAAANEEMLYKQLAPWGELRLDLRDESAVRHRYQHGLDDYDWTGRGGAALWRAVRRVESQDLEQWLQGCGGSIPAERRVNPPSWLIRMPAQWHARVVATGTTPIPEPYSDWISAGRLLAIPLHNGQAVWPLTPSNDQTGWKPVAGIEPLLAPTSALSPNKVIGYIEAMLVDWSDNEADDLPHQLRLPADQARNFGFIDGPELQRILRQARADTIQLMDDLLASGDLEDHQREALESAGGPAEFVRSPNALAWHSAGLRRPGRGRADR